MDAMNAEPLQKRLAVSRANLARLDREREVAAIEVRAFEEALRLIGEDEGEHEPVAAKRRKRAGDERWLAVLEDLPAAPQTFGYDEVLLAAEIHDIGMTRGAARAKMMTLVEGGSVERVRDGVFRLPARKTAVIGDGAQLSPQKETSAWTERSHADVDLVG